MSNFVPFNRGQAFLLLPDLKRWLPEDNVAHFVVAAVEWVPLGVGHLDMPATPARVWQAIQAAKSGGGQRV